MRCTDELGAQRNNLHSFICNVDHPCTVREARCLQQDGVLPTVTLVLIPTPPQAPPAPNPLTPERHFAQQDFEGLKYAYKATLKVLTYLLTMDRVDHVEWHKSLFYFALAHAYPIIIIIFT